MTQPTTRSGRAERSRLWMLSRVCTECSDAFVSETRTVTCSKKCRELRGRRLAIARQAAKKSPKPCAWCGSLFALPYGTRVKASCCSPECLKKHKVAQHRSNSQKYRARHPERIRLRSRRRYLESAESRKLRNARRARWRAAHPEKVREEKRRYIQRHRKEENERRRRRWKAWRKKNRTLALKKEAIKRERNRQRIREDNLRYSKRHLARVRARGRLHYTLDYKIDRLLAGLDELVALQQQPR